MELIIVLIFVDYVVAISVKERKVLTLPQKQSLRPSRQIKVGNEPVLVLPRVCYRCDGKVHDIIISTVEKTEFTK